MDEDPLKVDTDTPLHVAAALAMQRVKSKIFDHVIVVRNGSLVGIVSVPKMLKTLANLERERREEIFRMSAGPMAANRFPKNPGDAAGHFGVRRVRHNVRAVFDITVPENDSLAGRGIDSSVLGLTLFAAL